MWASFSLFKRTKICFWTILGVSEQRKNVCFWTNFGWFWINLIFPVVFAKKTEKVPSKYVNLQLKMYRSLNFVLFKVRFCRKNSAFEEEKITGSIPKNFKFQKLENTLLWGFLEGKFSEQMYGNRSNGKF